MSRTLAAWLVLAAAATTTGAPGGPREVVQAAVTRVLALLEEAQLQRPEVEPGSRLATIDQARAEIRRLAAGLFDFPEVARRTLGRHWAGRTPAEQREFVGLFTELLERAYLGRIEQYAGERILYTGEAVEGRFALVRSRIVTRRRTEMALDYRLHRVDGRWKVYDVLIDGVSFVSTYRSEFDRILQSSSWDDVMDRLRKRRLEIRPVATRTAG